MSIKFTGCAPGCPLRNIRFQKGAHELPYAATMWPLFTATSFTADLFLTVKAPLCHEIVGLEKDQKVLGFILG